MNGFSRSLQSWLRRAARLHARLVTPVLVATLACLAAANVLSAAPVSLQFAALVGPPQQGDNGPLPPLPPNWNTSLFPGDIISGTFTIEPLDAESNVNHTAEVQPFDFSIHINGRTLNTSQYGIEVYNNQTSDDAPEPADRVYMGCPLLLNQASCVPETVAPDDPIKWSFQLALLADSSALDGADIPTDPLVWQRFKLGSIVVSFNDYDARRFYSFSATPKSFEAVPEPSTLILVLVSTLSALLFDYCFANRR